MNEKVVIILATYNPNMEWFQKLLESINAQTYSNLELLVRDDFSSEQKYIEISQALEKTIKNLRYRLARNESNMGSNKTFELLSKEAEGDYIAFCDQDDIWKKNKIEVLLEEIKKCGAVLACSDMEIVNDVGNVIAKSITDVRPRHMFKSGEIDPTELLFHNFVTGCTMLCATRVVKDAIPFNDCFVHDNWIAIYAAYIGTIISVEIPLICYRIHSNNQTGVLHGINTKEKYYSRIDTFERQLIEIKQRCPQIDLLDLEKFLDARKRNYNGSFYAACQLWKMKYIDRSTALFEIIVLRMPQLFFKRIVQYIRKGKV